MTILGLVLSTGLSLLFLVVLFVPLERMFPAQRQGFWRPEWWTDLFFLLGQYFVWGGLVLGLLQIFRGQLHAVIPEDSALRCRPSRGGFKRSRSFC
jgi:hypothetical protein